MSHGRRGMMLRNKTKPREILLCRCVRDRFFKLFLPTTMPAFSSQTPLRNPYETFTGKDLDSFVADIKSKVNNALKPPRRSSPPRFRGSLVAASLPVLPHLNPLYQHKESPLDLTSTAEGPTAGDTTLNWLSPDKGKARAVDEGPGVEALRNLRPSSQSPRVATKSETARNHPLRTYFDRLSPLQPIPGRSPSRAGFPMTTIRRKIRSGIGGIITTISSSLEMKTIM